MPARAEHPLGQDLAPDAVVFFLQHLHVDIAVVHHDHVAFGNVVDQAVVVDVDRVFFLAARSADGELHGVPRCQVQAGRQIARADGRALGVHHHGDVRLGLACHFADARDNGADPLVRAVAHVQPENVGPRADQAGEHFA